MPKESTTFKAGLNFIVTKEKRVNTKWENENNCETENDNDDDYD